MNDGDALTPTEAKALLVKILTEGGIVEYRPHARQEMAKDGITEAKVVSVLKGGVVEPAEFVNGEWRYRVRVLPIYVVVTFIAETHTAVVTAWKRKRP
jgi:hypothetical protein